MRRIIIIYLLISAVCLYAQNSKLSPFVRQAMMTCKDIPAISMAKGSHAAPAAKVPVITAFVRTTDTDVLRQQGCRIYAQWNPSLRQAQGKLSSGQAPLTSIVIASIPLNQLSTLASKPQVQRIEAGRSCSVTNDTTATITRTCEVWGQTIPSTINLTPSPLKGGGVVVGVMDIGFDLTHPTFYSSDGQTYRIKQLWDQLDWTQGGEAVIGKTADDRDTIYVGRQYIGQEALLALQHSADGLTQTHGTHTTGTAAGSGWQGSSSLSSLSSNLYSGMAPDATICLVCNAAGDNIDLIPDSLQYLYTTATDMLGFKYIFDYADKVGKPCVISFSEGAYDNLWESSLYGEVLSEMLGPGHILCSSAGNEGGGDGTYIHKAEGEVSKGAFLARPDDNTACYVLRSKEPVQMRLSFYQDNKDVLDKEYDLTELAQFPDSVMTDSIIIADDTLVVYLETYPSCYDETLYATDFCLVDTSDENCGSSVPAALTLLGSDNDIEAFCGGGYFVKNSLCDPTLADFDRTHNILFPGSSKDVICVGNTSYRTTYINYEGTLRSPFGTSETDGVISRYSSVGPAISGLTKPDVVAPGINVISGYNSFYRENNPTSDRSADVLDFTCNSRTYQWHAMSGTSMSAPVVAGIIALWLQVCPTLTPDQVKDVIAHTATHYVDSAGSRAEWPNNSYGCGQIDAQAGVEYIQQHYTGIQEVSGSSQGSGGKADPQSLVPGSTSIYTLDGRRINSIDGQHGIFIVGGKKVVR